MNINRVLYIIIPVFNDATALKKVIASLLSLNYINIVIVDDGSIDNEGEELQQLPVTYLRHVVNLGQGAALQTGINFARNEHAELIVTFDADGQHSPNDIPALIKPIIENEADIVFGSRFLSSQPSGMPAIRKAVLQTARFINLIFSGILLSDAHNGLRAMNSKAFSIINISENRMAHASEILLEVKKSDLRWKEVPVTINYTANSMAKGQSSMDSIRILFDLVLHKLFK